jgi:hypothetical protein
MILVVKITFTREMGTRRPRIVELLMTVLPADCSRYTTHCGRNSADALGM